MTPPGLRQPKRALGRVLGTALAFVLMASTMIFASACGGSGQAASAAGQGPGEAAQTMVTVKRGNLVATLIGKLTLTVTNGSATGTARFSGDGASKIAAGQTVTIIFMAQAGNGVPSSGQGSRPPAAGSGRGSPPPSVAPSAQSGGQSPQPAGGQGPGPNVTPGKTTRGTVSSVEANSDGSLTAQIAIAKLPSGVTAKSAGMASINAGVLVKNVLIVPTAAISGSGSNATVQVIVAGKTTTRKVVVGKQTRAESEIVSGLSEGESVVYERAMPGLPAQNGSQ